MNCSKRRKCKLQQRPPSLTNVRAVKKTSPDIRHAYEHETFSRSQNSKTQKKNSRTTLVAKDRIHSEFGTPPYSPVFFLHSIPIGKKCGLLT